LAGATRETAPIFAALWAGSPMPLLGLVGIPLWRKGVPPWRYQHLYHEPWKRFAKMRWKGGWHLGYLAAWGAFIPAFPNALNTMPLTTLLTLALSALPLLRSVDTMRLMIPWMLPILALSLCQLSHGALVASLLMGVVLSSQWQE
jgi:hypothetical protein